MAQKRLIAPLAVAALLVTAGCLGGVTGLGDGNPTAGEPSDDGNTNETPSKISVSATGEATAEPDRAVLSVSVEATAADPETARRAVARNATSMREALAGIGLGDEQVTTRHYAVREAYEPKRDEATKTTYRAIHAFEVEIENVDRVGTVIETATSNGATGVGGVQFTLSEATRSELREKALTNAMNNARDDAEILAANANLTVSDADAVTIDTGTVRPYRTEANVAANGGGTDFEFGPVSVTARVQVTYNATR
ncbi:SIMPL domain-containing protein [Haladaptatus salinisoli]|uniref:SIMPL domain-containing protein n=1 Tax=Haladaptatus salinisoli TaxID=2884876 RepID=UPI001D0AB79E|nr:SIMPL domain-containing protein [Haladaptatus salinisoli]